METLGSTFKSFRSTCKCYLGATDRQVPPLFGVLRRWISFFLGLVGWRGCYTSICFWVCWIILGRMYYVYDDESDAVQYNTPLLHRDICRWMVGERKIENRIYILEKKSCRCSNCYSISCLLLANWTVLSWEIWHKPG